MPLVFDHETRGQRVLFGAGRAADSIAAEVARLDAVAPFVIASGRHQRLVEQAGLSNANRWTQVVEHVPVAIADAARSAAAGADLLVAIGGGSATGLAKAIALTSEQPSGLPIVAVPTTFAGSEATDVWGLTELGSKRTGNDLRVLPATVVYDADLVASLPSSFAVASGLNAVAHCVDAMWGPRTDPIDEALAMEALRALRTGLPGVLAGETDGIERTLYGGYLAAVAFASAGSGLHHKICHVLGGAYDLPHAATHAIVLPHVLAFNAPYAATAAERIAAALGDADASAGLLRLGRTLSAPSALRAIGFRYADIPGAVSVILPQIPGSNPRPVDAAALSTLLRAAWSGEPSELTKESG